MKSNSKHKNDIDIYFEHDINVEFQLYYKKLMPVCDKPNLKEFAQIIFGLFHRNYNEIFSKRWEEGIKQIGSKRLKRNDKFLKFFFQMVATDFLQVIFSQMELIIFNGDFDYTNNHLKNYAAKKSIVFQVIENESDVENYKKNKKVKSIFINENSIKSVIEKTLLPMHSLFMMFSFLYNKQRIMESGRKADEKNILLKELVKNLMNTERGNREEDKIKIRPLVLKGMKRLKMDTTNDSLTKTYKNIHRQLKTEKFI